MRIPAWERANSRGRMQQEQENRQTKEDEGRRPTYCIVHRRGAGREEAEREECELEAALEQGYAIIVVEPPGLGEQTVRWIRAGNFLHKSAVLATLSALVTLPFLPPRIGHVTVLPLGLFGVCCAGLYDISWQFDPCCKYQVDHHGKELTHVPSQELVSHTPVVLSQKNDKYRRRLHNTLAAILLGYLGWRLYKYCSC